jgi:hypothetical protein
MKTSTWVVIGLAVMAPAAGGCKSKASTEATPTATTAAVAPAPAPAKTTAPAGDTPFEGEIQLAVYQPSSKTPQTIAYDVKGDKVRAQTVGGDPGTARVVGDRKDKKVFAVVDASKSYANVDVGTPTPALPPVTRTSKVEHVLGRDCEDWTITDGGERFDLCVAKGIAYLDNPAGAGEPGWAAVLTREHAFPLKVVATDKTGKQEFRAEATKIEVRHLDDALFKVPADYHAGTLAKSVKVASIP